LTDRKAESTIPQNGQEEAPAPETPASQATEEPIVVATQ